MRKNVSDQEFSLALKLTIVGIIVTALLCFLFYQDSHMIGYIILLIIPLLILIGLSVILLIKCKLLKKRLHDSWMQNYCTMCGNILDGYVPPIKEKEEGKTDEDNTSAG